MRYKNHIAAVKHFGNWRCVKNVSSLNPGAILWPKIISWKERGNRCVYPNRRTQQFQAFFNTLEKISRAVPLRLPIFIVLSSRWLVCRNRKQPGIAPLCLTARIPVRRQKSPNESERTAIICPALGFPTKRLRFNGKRFAV